MGAGRALALVVTGAAGAAGILAASPATYETLRRRLRLVGGREHFADEPAAELPRDEEAGSGADLRLSLRARLAQDADIEAASGPPADDADPRSRLAAARTRLEAAAATATAAVEAPGDPSVLEEDTADMPLPGAAERT